MRTRLLLVVLIATLVACSGPAVIPVSDLSRANSNDKARVVAEGDSLYQISWEAGLDYRDVARWNNLNPPYRLSTGRIDLFERSTQLGGNVNPVDLSTPTGRGYRGIPYHFSNRHGTKRAESSTIDR